MATNPIAADTRNVTVNLIETQVELLGKRAFSLSKSRGEYIKHLISLGLQLEDPALAAKWRRARAQRWAKSVAMAAFGAVTVWHSLANDTQLYRAARGARRKDETCQS